MGFEEKFAETQAKMRIEDAKAMSAEKKKAAEQAEKEALIADMLSYAENCQKLAYEYVKEADKTMQEARDMIEKFEADKGAE